MDFCSAPRDPGPCTNYETRYGYNAATDTCVEYQYGGCDGTLNNFRSLQRCTEICCKEYKRKLWAKSAVFVKTSSSLYSVCPRRPPPVVHLCFHHFRNIKHMAPRTGGNNPFMLFEWMTNEVLSATHYFLGLVLLFHLRFHRIVILLSTFKTFVIFAKFLNFTAIRYKQQLAPYRKL